MSYHQYTYDGDPNDLILVANPTDEDITVHWGGVPHSVPAGETVPYTRSLSMHITKKIMEREERKRGDKGEKSLRKPETWQKWQKKVMVQVLKEYGDRVKPTDGQRDAAKNDALRAEFDTLQKRINQLEHEQQTNQNQAAGDDRPDSGDTVSGTGKKPVRTRKQPAKAAASAGSGK